MVTHVLVERVSDKDLFLQRLPRATSRAFLEIANTPLLVRTQWYLAGGTALALQTGHRASVDLDFFTERSGFNETAWERKLLATGKWQTSLREEGTLFGLFHGAKMSFIAYPFFHPGVRRYRYGNVAMLVPEDIAAMKIVAISQRGRKRDFIDLYWYCVNRESLRTVIQRAVRQYPGQERNIHHILKSLVYFKDAEEDPTPRLFFTVSWERVKIFFRREVPSLVPGFS